MNLVDILSISICISSTLGISGNGFLAPLYHLPRFVTGMLITSGHLRCGYLSFAIGLLRFPYSVPVGASQHHVSVTNYVAFPMRSMAG